MDPKYPFLSSIENCSTTSKLFSMYYLMREKTQFSGKEIIYYNLLNEVIVKVPAQELLRHL